MRWWWCLSKREKGCSVSGTAPSPLFGSRKCTPPNPVSRHWRRLNYVLTFFSGISHMPPSPPPCLHQLVIRRALKLYEKIFFLLFPFLSAGHPISNHVLHLFKTQRRHFFIRCVAPFKRQKTLADHFRRVPAGLQFRLRRLGCIYFLPGRCLLFATRPP